MKRDVGGSHEPPCQREGLGVVDFAADDLKVCDADSHEERGVVVDDVGSPRLQSPKAMDPPAWRRRMIRLDPVVKMGLQWSLGVLLVLFLAFIVFGILYSGIHYHGDSWCAGESKCVTPYGSVLGVHNGVFAYSNCNDDYTSNVANNASNGEYSGMQWQCVEYARRYWILRGSPVPATFGSVEGAADIWDLASVRLADGTVTPLLKYPNGLAVGLGGSAPRLGDLLIYPRQPGGFPYGHVAVVVGVTNASVLVAEQNWANAVWPGPHHNCSREIPLRVGARSTSYSLLEAGGVTLLGWVRYAA